MTSSRARIASLGVLATIVTLWVLLAPTQLGGPTSFARIVGVSMEPKLHAGDLVVVRRSTDYRVGDVVAYRSAVLHQVVLHRIVAIHGDRYTFKGDNNDFLDPGGASRSELVGREWMVIGGGGRLFDRLHSPWVAALLAVLAVVVLLGSGKVPVRRGARGRRVRTAPSVPAGWAPLLGPVTLVAGAVSVGCLVLAGIALATPSHRAAPLPDLVDYDGTFSYSATAPVSAAYPTGRIATGQTVFTRLVHSVDFRFVWRLAATRPHAVAGTASLAAVVADGSGWTRSFSLQPPHGFAADRATVRGRLDLDAVRSLVSSFERETGTNLGQYTVSIVPTIVLRGVVAGQPVADTYRPTLDLVLGRDSLQMPSAPETPGFVRSKSVSGTASTANRLAFGPFGASVTTVRVLTVLGGLLALLVLGGATTASRRLAAQDPIERELALSGQAVVRIQDERRAARLVDVRHFAGLLRLARRYDRLVLYAEMTGAYLVEDDDIVYRWRPPAADGTPPAGEERPPRVERRDLATRPWAERPGDTWLAETGEA